MFIKAPFVLDEFYQEIIRDELNVKNVVFTDDVREFTSYTFKPQLRTVGPKYGKQMGGIQKTLATIDGNGAMDDLKANGFISFEVDGVEVKLAEEDLLINIAQKEGYVTEADNTVTVVLDTNLTPELIEEGYVYEVISKIQTMRKEADFEVMDHIRVSLNDNAKLAAVVEANKDGIAAKVLADSIVSGETYSITKDWDINGEKAIISIERV